MNSPIKEYHMTLETIGPVYIGNGKEIDKKGYIFTDRKHINIIDLEKMYMNLSKKGLGDEYEKFLIGKGKLRLEQWLSKNNINKKDIDNCVKYGMQCGDSMDINSAEIKICEHIKDPYNMPYIPGSSIKGMLRTILTAYDIMNNPQKYSNAKNSISYNVLSNQKIGRKQLAAREIKSIETDCFNELQRDEKNKGNAVNDIMGGIIVSDSESIDISNLILCKKLEGHVDGKEHELNVVRECIKPNTKIRFTITIDETVCDSITIDTIIEAIKSFANNYNKVFVSKFKSADLLEDNNVILGGGTGFVSKTIIYPLFGQADGFKVTRQVLKRTTKPDRENKTTDASAGVSPHIIKYTSCNGRILQMGLCRLTLDK